METAQLKESPLFRNVAPDFIERMMNCLSIRQRTFRKDAYIFTAEDPPSEIGVVISGTIDLIKDDYWGNRAIITKVFPGGIFGESSSCPAVHTIPLSAVAAETAEVLLFDYKTVTTVCSNVCPSHTALIQNMLSLIAQKNLTLTNKISHLVRRTTREKLLSFFSEQAEAAGNHHFTIPYNRQELADYLSVDRSAMSTELSKLRHEGLLVYHKNEFTLL